MNSFVPYTYLIGWSSHNLYYYGSEYSLKNKIANPSNLWCIYYTSSNYVHKARVALGEPDIIQVRKKIENYDTEENAQQKIIDHERKVLRRMKVLQREDFLNKNIAGAYLLDKDTLLKRGNSISMSKKGKTAHNKITLDPQVVSDLYVNQLKSIIDICSILGVSRPVVKRSLKEAGVVVDPFRRNEDQKKRLSAALAGRVRSLEANKKQSETLKKKNSK